MNDFRRRLALAGILALALGPIGGTGAAHAAKLRVTAPGAPVPNATGGGPLALAPGSVTRTFTLKGKKVKGQQVLDVNLVVNATGSLDANDDLFATLIAPNGLNTDVPLPTIGSSMLNLKFDDQSRLVYCDPFENVASYCNYIQGATSSSPSAGFFTGSVRAGQYAAFSVSGFNRFRGANPKGKWRLEVFDRVVNPPATPETSTLGVTTLEVTTGRKFATQGK